MFEYFGGSAPLDLVPLAAASDWLESAAGEAFPTSRFVASAILGSTFLATACAFFYRAWKERKGHFGIYLLAAIALLSLGTTSSLAALGAVLPMASLVDGLRLFNALVCAGVGLVVIPIIPHALLVRSPNRLIDVNRQLREEYLSARRAQEAMELTKCALEKSVTERTQSLMEAKEALEKELFERQRIETELRKSEQRFRKLVDSNIVGVMVSALDGRLVETNDAFLDMLGYTREEFDRNHLRWDELTPPQFAVDDQTHIREVRERGACTPYEKAYYHRSGRLVPVLLGYAMLEEGGDLVIAYAVDLSHAKNVESELRSAQDNLQKSKDDLEVRINERTHALSKALQEKELLLKEIHHRVKNNLNVVSSLLSLQARQINDPGFRAALQESRDRINSITTIHEKLYQSQNLASICFRDYLQDLIKNLRTNYAADTREISIELDVEALFLGIDMAIPCGLIVNELVTNSLKYAFTEGKGGVISVGLSTLWTGDLELTVRDDGRGIPANLNFHTTSSLGLRLVSMLTRQLGGTVQMSSGSGTNFSFQFPASAVSRVPDGHDTTLGASSPSAAQPT